MNQAQVAKGRRTLVTVQFGHNDQKVADPKSMGANMTVMAAQIIKAGGEPVLVTPLTRRNFNSNGTIADTLQPWADGEHSSLILIHYPNLNWFSRNGACSF